MSKPDHAKPLTSSQINLIQMCAGAGAGLSASLVVNPLDVIKIRLQNQRQGTQGTWQTCQSLLREEGYKGLFRGIKATTCAYCVDRAIWFPVYQSFKRNLSRFFRKYLCPLYIL
jgi:solute carrier family 25 folate transporter 32